MTTLRLLAPALAVALSASAVSAQRQTVAFHGTDGHAVYRIPLSEASDPASLQRASWIFQLHQRFAAQAATNDSAAEVKAKMEARWPGFSKDYATSADASTTETVSPPTERATQGKYVIHGDCSAVYASGTFVMFRPGGAKKGGAMMGATAMGSAAKKKDDRIPGEIARAKLVDGRFTVEGEIEDVHQVYFYVRDAVTHSGVRMGPTKGQGFLLEPGELQFTVGDNYKHTLVGGYFNDRVYRSWQGSRAYQDLQTLLPLAFRRLEGETEQQTAAFQRIGSAVQSALLDTETEGRKQIALSDPDLLVRQLAIETAWLGGPWMAKGAREILALEPDNAWAKAFVERDEARSRGKGQNARAGSVGGRYLPFNADSLAGQSVSLSKVCKENRYVLLEFWASWCGPCRKEIPHMKKAYEHYREHGFEIFGYTLDDKRAAWAKASTQEGLPWINTGFGAKSDPVLLYAVQGVPANYLIDGKTGMVVARDLRGEALDAKLAELFARNEKR